MATSWWMRVHKIPVSLAIVVAAGLSGCARSFRSAADLPQEALALSQWLRSDRLCAAREA